MEVVHLEPGAVDSVTMATEHGAKVVGMWDSALTQLGKNVK